MKYKYLLFCFYKPEFLSEYLSKNPLNLKYYGGWNNVSARPIGVRTIDEAIAIINDEDSGGHYWEIVNLETWRLEKMFRIEYDDKGKTAIEQRL